jgi:hypothetical protein
MGIVAGSGQWHAGWRTGLQAAGERLRWHPFVKQADSKNFPRRKVQKEQWESLS